MLPCAQPKSRISTHKVYAFRSTWTISSFSFPEVTGGLAAGNLTK